jgi:Heparinase II/III-like protein/Heparinase II/III N-terminus
MTRINRYRSWQKTLFALGILNLWRAFYYRLSIKLRINPVRRLRASMPKAGFFRAIDTPRINRPPPNDQWWDTVLYFGIHPVQVGAAPPDWHLNPLNQQRIKQPDRDWWQIADFDRDVGDIKCVWEASRFDWVISFAQRAAIGATIGEPDGLARLESWLVDWCAQNPAYHGPNWKCGQEASIRVMHLAMAARLLDQHRSPQPALLDLIDIHLDRIAPTISYAVAQDNNHGTSEAAALFIGGSWLAACRPNSYGHKWAKLGRFWLENRVQHLIEIDGSFSQYSVNYHRVMLDTLSMAEIWRREWQLADFSIDFVNKAQAASTWLHRMTCSDNGDVPNIGANDGARLLPLSNTDYRDFRPSVQLAMVLFHRRLAYSQEGSWNDPLRWLNIDLPHDMAAKPESMCMDQGGYVCLVQSSAFAVLHYPRFKFRPSQADALHVDFWLDGINILRDAGSFSYHTEANWLHYFPATAAHNTVQFDDRDQMTRLSRFLFGDWLKTRQSEYSFTADKQQFGVSYADNFGAVHARQVELTDQTLLVTDQIRGFQKKAVLRWRLMPGTWRLQGCTLSNGQVSLTLSADMPLSKISLTEGWESRYYLQRTALPVLEIEMNHVGSISTLVEWNR